MNKRHFLFLNIGHFLDHFFILIFATVAALSLTNEWQLSYAQLIPYSMAGFIAFGLFSTDVSDQFASVSFLWLFQESICRSKDNLTAPSKPPDDRYLSGSPLRKSFGKLMFAITITFVSLR